MALKYTIIGFLLDKPMHGYQLKRTMSPGLPSDLLINDGIIYPLLAKMEKAGLIRKKVKKSERTPDRHVFYPTSKGRQLFVDWLTSTTLEADELGYDFVLGHPFLIKCLFFRHLTRAQIIEKFMAQRTSTLEKLRSFNTIRAFLKERTADPMQIAVLDLGISQQQAKIRWVNKMIQSFKKTHSSAAADLIASMAMIPGPSSDIAIKTPK